MWLILFFWFLQVCSLAAAPYEISNCMNNSVDIFETGRTRINCTGLSSEHNIYWSISFDNGTEGRIADCNKCNITCPGCTLINGDYNVTRDDTFSVLRLVKGDDRQRDGATIQCSRKNNNTAVNCTLRVQTYTLPQCEDGKLNVSDVPPWTAIKCADVDRSHRVNWTITHTNGSVLTIATCEKKSADYNCTPYSDEFTVTRNDTVSELMIVKRIKSKDNETLTCVRRDGAAAVDCRLRVVSHQYNLPQCQDGQLYVSVFAPWTPIRCENLIRSHVIHWTITDPHGNVSNVATCDKKHFDFNCTLYNNDYNVSRINASVSELIIVKEVGQKAGSNITCMRDNGNIAVSCYLRAIPYTLPQCQDGRLNVSNVPRYTPIRCEDLDPGQGVNWTITSKDGNLSTIATCGIESEDFNCTMIEDGFNVTRNNSKSELTITVRVKSKDNETLTCMRTDGAAAVDCRLRVVVHQYSLPQCHNGQLSVSDVSPWTPIRCEDLLQSHVINWTVTDHHGNTSTVATCDRKANGFNCTTYNDDYNVSRTNESVSELMIVKEVREKTGSNVTCMRDNGKFAVRCNLHVIPFTLPQCQDGRLNVSDVPPWTPIRCEDLDPGQGVNWTITSKGTVSTIATCEDFNCTVVEKVINVTRNNSTSELMITGGVMSKDNETLTCMRTDGAAAVDCRLRVVPHQYNLPQCHNGQLYVSDFVPWTPIRCENLIRSHEINWTITDHHGNTSTVATCDKGSGRFNCTTCNDDYTVSRINESVSELMIVKKVREKAGSNVTCVSDNGNVAVSCRLHVFPEADGNQDMQLFATVGGVLGAVVLIIVVVVVIVVITRRQKEGPRRPRKNFPENLDASFDDSNTEGYSRISDIVGDNAHNVMSVDNPCFIGTTASSVPMQLSTVSASALARNGNETQDLDEHTYTAVDLEDDVWKKGSGGPAENTGRVVILKQDPSAKTKRGALTGPDGYSDIDIQPDTHHVGAQGPRKVTFKEENSQGFPSPSNSPFKSKMHTASDEEDYSHLVINAAIQEVPNASKNVTFSNPDASEYSLAKVMPASTGKETPDDADAYNRIAITSNTADTQLQDTKNVHIENQDACSTLPAIATISNRDTERAAGEDPYDHIQADDYRHIVITSAKEEGAQASKNVASSNPNTGEYALAKVLPASTGKETPDDDDAYNRISITSNTADKQLQDTKNADIKNQDTGFTTRD